MKRLIYSAAQPAKMKYMIGKYDSYEGKTSYYQITSDSDESALLEAINYDKNEFYSEWDSLDEYFEDHEEYFDPGCGGLVHFENITNKETFLSIKGFDRRGIRGKSHKREKIDPMSKWPDWARGNRINNARDLQGALLYKWPIEFLTTPLPNGVRFVNYVLPWGPNAGEGVVRIRIRRYVIEIRHTNDNNFVIDINTETNDYLSGKEVKRTVGNLADAVKLAHRLASTLTKDDPTEENVAYYDAFSWSDSKDPFYDNYTKGTAYHSHEYLQNLIDNI